MRKIKEIIEKMLTMSTEDLKKYCRKVEKNVLIDINKELSFDLRWNDSLSVEQWKNYDRLNYYVTIELDRRQRKKSNTEDKARIWALHRHRKMSKKIKGG